MRKMLIGFICFVGLLLAGCGEVPLHLRDENSFQSVMMSEKISHTVDKFMVSKVDGEVMVYEAKGMFARISDEATLFHISEDEILYLYGGQHYHVNIKNIDSEKVIYFDNSNLIPEDKLIEFYKLYKDLNYQAKEIYTLY